MVFFFENPLFSWKISNSRDFFLETKQQSQATTIENLKSETSWQIAKLLIKRNECSKNFYFDIKAVVLIHLSFGNIQKMKNNAILA